MKTWAPLWGSILSSSIWGESKDVKILWITMMAMKDRNGFVESSLPGLARAAVLSIKECQVALKVLESPDPLSSSKEFEGRRVKAVDKGWVVLNHFKYRDEIKNEYRKEYQRQKQAEYRNKKKGKPSPGEAAFTRAVESGDESLADQIIDSHTKTQGS